MKELASQKRSGWEIYKDEAERSAMRALADGYMNFLSRAKTERETVAAAMEQLEAAGFRAGFEGGRGLVHLHGKALFAARRGRRPLAEGLRLISAHTDSPRLDLKQHPLIEQVGVGQAKTHYYGGLRKYQWFARPLALHGVVVKAGGEALPSAWVKDRGNLSSPLPTFCRTWPMTTPRRRSPTPLKPKS